MFELNRLYNLDCMEAMRKIPDKFFNLAICDPPYGIGHDGQQKRVTENPKHSRKHHARKGWDKQPSPHEYFAELERISVNQIIWGGNYFVPMLSKGTKGWIVWDKGQHGLTMSDCELAYTSFDCPTLNFRTLTRDAVKLHEQRNHQIELRVAQQDKNTSGQPVVSNLESRQKRRESGAT
jgi:site-specific DNA-methyltransferase (adenine-specific)